MIAAQKCHSIVIYFEWRDTENQQLLRMPNDCSPKVSQYIAVCIHS